MNDEKYTIDADKIFTCCDVISARPDKGLNLTVLSFYSLDSVADCGRKPAVYSFQGFRALSRLLPPTTAARLARLARAANDAIESNDWDRYARARWLEIAVAEIAEARPMDANTQELQRYLTRLLRQSFRSLDWRRPLIAGLRPRTAGPLFRRKPARRR
jgi:hypothetical protein